MLLSGEPILNGIVRERQDSIQRRQPAPRSANRKTPQDRPGVGSSQAQSPRLGLRAPARWPYGLATPLSAPLCPLISRSVHAAMTLCRASFLLVEPRYVSWRPLGVAVQPNGISPARRIRVRSRTVARLYSPSAFAIIPRLTSWQQNEFSGTTMACRERILVDSCLGVNAGLADRQSGR